MGLMEGGRPSDPDQFIPMDSITRLQNIKAYYEETGYPVSKQDRNLLENAGLDLAGLNIETTLELKEP